MPLQRDPAPRRVCLFGDSQLGSLREALTEGLSTPPPGTEIEFWGATGAQFRHIDWRDGAIRALGDARETVQSVNGQGRDHIAPGDFDAMVFYGARLRTGEFFGPHIHRVQTVGALPSIAVLRASARAFMENCRAWRLAVLMAGKGCRVIFVPSPFYTKGVTDMAARGRFLDVYPGADRATAEQRARLWAAMAEVAKAAGVTLVPQPDDTVTDGVLTKEEFARAGAVETGDTGHKSPAFAARWMAEVWPLLETRAEAA